MPPTKRWRFHNAKQPRPCTRYRGFHQRMEKQVQPDLDQQLSGFDVGGSVTKPADDIRQKLTGAAVRGRDMGQQQLGRPLCFAQLTTAQVWRSYSLDVKRAGSLDD